MIGARENNLKNVDVSIPLGKFVCITGVSGSGKSSLVTEILHQGARADDQSRPRTTGRCTIGSRDCSTWIRWSNIDQSPIGRTPQVESRHVHGALHANT